MSKEKSQTGVHHPPEVIEKMRAARREWWAAKKSSQSTKGDSVMVFKKKVKPTFEQWSELKETVAQFPKTPAVIVAEFQKSHQKDLNRIRVDAMREEYERQFGEGQEGV